MKDVDIITEILVTEAIMSLGHVDLGWRNEGAGREEKEKRKMHQSILDRHGNP